jgi:gliding-associated putative ABC transporter substrate-binding component GldG
MRTRFLQSIIQLTLFIGILIFLNIIASFFYGDIDLTEDQRFTLNEATYDLIEELDDVVTVEIYLAGELPSSFKRLNGAVIDLLNKFRSRTGQIQYRFVNPTDGTEEENMAMLEKLEKDDIVPINLTMTSGSSREARLVFPYAIIRYKQRQKVVSLLESTGGFNRDFTRMEAINPSINLLEYKFANAIQKLQSKTRPRMVLLTGHGELQRPWTESLEASMFEYYDIARLDLNKVTKIDTHIHVVIIPKPLYPFGEKHLFMIDQYVMNGGKVVWLVDALNMELDSMGSKGVFMPQGRPLDFHNLLFTYGVRVNANLVLDWEASSIPMQVGMNGDQPQIELRKWFYHPKAYPYHTPLEAQEIGENTIQHPIVQNLDFIDTRYPSSIDTVRTDANIKKTPLLRSSKYSKVQFPPVRVSINIADAKIGQDAFKKENQNIAVLLEGEFPSHYKGRVPAEMLASLQKMGQPYLEKAKPNGKMIVISDGDIAKNAIDRRSGKPLPLGMNKYDGYTYGNKDFLMNCLEYLIDNKGIIAARNKEIKLRPLDQERAFAEETTWQVINIVLPLLVLGIFGFVYVFARKNRFGK